VTRVLVIEDEPSFLEVLEHSLTKEGFDVTTAESGRSGLASFRSQPPDVVLLDLMLPELPGLDVLRAIRRESSTPVIVVSAKDAEADVVTALELGANDYVTKPYAVRELIARIRAATRRNLTTAKADVLTAGSARLDIDALRLIVGTTSIDLPKKEFEVLQLLMEQPDRVVPRDEFLDKVWGYAWIGETRTLDQHIRRLRRRLESLEDAPRIETVRGVGYRLAR
jgi:two-component system, OmpR family, response regulator RegX3